VRAKLTIGAEGELVLPAREAGALGLAAGDEVDLVTARGALALVAPARGEAPAAWFAGSLAALAVPEVIQFVFTSIKTGVLLLAFGSEADRAAAPDRPERLRRKSIYFREGQVVFASSSDPADRLGPVLVGAGIVSEEDLARSARLVASGRPLGQVLVDEGTLTSGQLYEGITRQVKEILLGAFLESAGTFAFLEGPTDEENAVKLPERTRDLLLEGMRRVDEAERLAAGLGGRDAVLARIADPARPLAPAEARLLEAVQGARPLGEAALAAGLGILHALRAASALFADGILTAEPAPSAPADASAPPDEDTAIEVESPAPAEPVDPAARATGPFETYRRILHKVHAALAAAQPDARGRLNSYFERLTPKQRAIFEGVRVEEDGQLDVARVLVNVSGIGTWKGAAARARALEALEDLLAFALFEVKNVLPRPAADRLLREVGKMQVGKA
jgi:hypothetical protein